MISLSRMSEEMIKSTKKRRVFNNVCQFTECLTVRSVSRKNMNRHFFTGNVSEWIWRTFWFTRPMIIDSFDGFTHPKRTNTYRHRWTLHCYRPHWNTPHKCSFANSLDSFSHHYTRNILEPITLCAYEMKHTPNNQFGVHRKKKIKIVQFLIQKDSDEREQNVVQATSD